MESHSQGDVPNTANSSLISIDVDHLRRCCHSLKNCSNTAMFTYKFFQELNDVCLQLNTANAIPKQHTLSATKSIESAKNEPIESCEEDDTVYIIQQLSQELFYILCRKSNINQNVQKMASITFINTLSLLCNIEVIINFAVDLIQIEDSTTSLTWVWTNMDNKCSLVKIDTDAMVGLKIMLSAGTSVRDWWHITQYKFLVVLILSFLSSHCSNKYLHHLVFSLQALKHCLDHTLKHDHTLIEESLQSKVFEVILGNWENYIPSVMDHNLLLCESFIRVLKRFDVEDEDVEKKKFWDFLTNVSCTLKSKYYMMSACFLADFYNKSVFSEPWFLENMAYSLSRSYLVTAGAYCHKVLAKNILDENRWKEIFLARVIELVCHSNISIRQNVCNYWLPAAVKQFPALIQPLYDLILARYERAKTHCLSQEDTYCRNRDLDQLQRYLHAVILMVKLERPGQFSARTHACVQDAMMCSDEMIRGDAFLCCQTFHGLKCHVPMTGMSEDSCQVFETVHRFLRENISCDDATLRQTMYKVFKNYVVNTECQFRKCVVPLDLNVRHKGSIERFQLPDFMHNYIAQYAALCEFFTDNLSTESNYQRLITTLSLLNILFENITHAMTENQKQKRRLTKDYLKEIGKWDFESALVRDRVFDCLAHDTNDVRVMAKHLLVSYFGFTSGDEDGRTFVRNVRTSLDMNKSNVFYTAESGAYGLVVLANLFYKAGLDRTQLRGELLAQFKKYKEDFELKEWSERTSCSEYEEKFKEASFGREVERMSITSDSPRTPALFSEFFFDVCQDQAARLQEDIVAAVKNKNCLHGSLTALMFLLTDPASPELRALPAARVPPLLRMLHTTCLHLLDLLCMTSRSTNFAPSFGEMGEALASLVTSDDEASEQLTLSPAHQTLLTCIWMNLKTACTFAAALAVAYRGSLARDQLVFACRIISLVLHRCRHKGAIQNAGLALGTILTHCLRGDSYPLHLLQETLRAALASTPGGALSRKSAGVAILVHRLLASQHHLVAPALDACLAAARAPVRLSEETLRVDLPQVAALHMLQFLVADAGLRLAMTSRLEAITRLCLDRMQSQEWTVRNGALQVFGVLLPKLVGTKKQDAASHSSNLAFEEFFYQLPRIGDSVRAVLCPVQGTGPDVPGADGTGPEMSGDETSPKVAGDETGPDVSGESSRVVLCPVQETDPHVAGTEVSGADETNTSVLVSALTLLSRLKVTGAFGPVNPGQARLKLFLRRVYGALLGSHMHTVRFLVANCFVNSLHSEAELLGHFDAMLFSCLEYIFRGEQMRTWASLRQCFGSSKMESFLQNDSREKIVDENHLHGSLLTLEILKERIYLENLELDEWFLDQMLTFLNTAIPCLIADSVVKPGTHALLFKIFRHENARRSPSVNEGQNVLDSFSDAVNYFKQDTRVGWKLFLQEVVKFQMFNQLLVRDGNVNFSYITRVVRELSLESDILKDVLMYLLQLLKELSLRNFDAVEKVSNSRTNLTVSSAESKWAEAHECIKDLLKTVVFCKMANTCAEHVFHVIIQIYEMFANDSVTSAANDLELLRLGNELFAIYCTKHSVEYICPAVLPVLSLCVSLPLPESVQQITPSIDGSSVPGVTTGNSPNSLDLVDKIHNLSNTFIHDEKCNEEYRYHAAVSMTILHNHNQFGQLTHDIVANTIHLLQDEVYEVRQEITYFVRKMEKNSRERTEKFLLLKNPYVYLFNFLNCSYAVDVHVYVDVFSSLLFVTEQDRNPSDTDSPFCNPFDHNLRNFYSEPMLIARAAYVSFNKLLVQTRPSSLDKTKLSDIIDKCAHHIEENILIRSRLNEHGQEKLRLLGQAKALLEKVVDQI